MHQIIKRAGHDEVRSIPLERLNRCGTGPREHPLQQQPDVLVGQVGILFGSGEGKLPPDDPLVQDEPRVVESGPGDVLKGAERIEAREERSRQSTAQRVEPHRRRAGQDPDAVVRPDGVPVLDPFHVVPHAVPIDDGSSCCLGDGEHPAIDVSRNAAEHPVGRRPQPGGPARPDQLLVAADAPCGHNHRPAAQLEFSDLNSRGGHSPRRCA